MAELNEQKVREICDLILTKYSEKFIKEAFHLLTVLFANIINNPSEDKFKNFKKSNNALKTKVLIMKENLDLIKEIGYVDVDDNILKYTGTVEQLKKAEFILHGYIERLEKKLSEEAQKQEEEKQKEIRKNMEEINRRMREKRIEEEKIRKQLENDRKEKAQEEKPTDSVGKDLHFGAKMVQFKPSCNPRGG